MKSPTFEELQPELERQARELEALLDQLGAIDPRDVPRSFFEELDAACEPAIVRSPTLAPFPLFGLRA